MKKHIHTSPSSHTRNAQALERRRLKAVKFLQKGRSQADIARQFGVTRSAANQWCAAWKKRGAAGLKAKKKPGRSPKLTKAKTDKVVRALLKGPHAFGYTTDIWTLERIAKVIKKVAKVSYHPGHVWRVLRALGWSCQKPETRARERDEKAIKQWLKDTWPEIKKRGSKTKPV